MKLAGEGDEEEEEEDEGFVDDDEGVLRSDSGSGAEASGCWRRVAPLYAGGGVTTRPPDDVGCSSSGCIFATSASDVKRGRYTLDGKFPC